MAYQADMAWCIQYIDQHLQENLTGALLADQLGYSYHHFCHVFRIYHDIPVGEYIRWRRLIGAGKAICDGVPVIQAALMYGFDTPSGFSKAFKRTFGVSPTQYRQQQMQTNKKGGNRMQPRIMEKEKIMAVGYAIKPNANPVGDAADRGAYWDGKDFSSVSKEDYAKLATPNHGDLATWLHPEDNHEDLTYFFGPVVESFDFIPDGMITLEIPAAKYAVFSVEADSKKMSRKEYTDAIKNTWKYIFQEWFEQSGYAYDQTKYNFELYLNKDIEIYIPIL